MKKIALVLIAIASINSIKAGCLNDANQVEGKLVKFHWDWSMPEWYTATIRVVSNYYYWQSMKPVQPQAIYVAFETTAMTLKGVMLKGYGGKWLEYGGVFLNPLNDDDNVAEIPHSWQRCGYYSNVHVDVRVYGTLPPVGTLIDRAQYWINAK